MQLQWKDEFNINPLHSVVFFQRCVCVVYLHMSTSALEFLVIMNCLIWLLGTKKQYGFLTRYSLVFNWRQSQNILTPSNLPTFFTPKTNPLILGSSLHIAFPCWNCRSLYLSWLHAFLRDKTKLSHSKRPVGSYTVQKHAASHADLDLSCISSHWRKEGTYNVSRRHPFFIEQETGILS